MFVNLLTTAIAVDQSILKRFSYLSDIKVASCRVEVVRRAVHLENRKWLPEETNGITGDAKIRFTWRRGENHGVAPRGRWISRPCAEMTAVNARRSGELTELHVSNRITTPRWSCIFMALVYRCLHTILQGHIINECFFASGSPVVRNSFLEISPPSVPFAFKNTIFEVCLKNKLLRTYGDSPLSFTLTVLGVSEMHTPGCSCAHATTRRKQIFPTEDFLAKSQEKLSGVSPLRRW